MFRRFISRTALVVALLASGLVALAPQRAEATDIQNIDSFMDWSMCGRLCGNGGGNGVADALVNSVLSRSPLPYAVMMQEICEPQWVRIRDKLRNSGSSTTDTFITTVSNAADCSGTGGPANYGSGVFWRGGFQDQYIKVFNHNPETEKRTIVCGDAINPAYYACSTHLDDDLANAKPQAVEAHDIAQWFRLVASRCSQFTGGDFNLEPSNSDSRTAPGTALDNWYLNFNEGDGDGRTYGSTFSSYRYTTDSISRLSRAAKSDYFWVPTGTHYITHDAYIYASGWSDHHLCQGYPKHR